MQDFEKLGLFYLGRSYDPATQKAEDDLVLYDARDLVTHAVCVGMTGSGKTGLCISLLEEAIIDHVPAIAIDPKGDLSNLLSDLSRASRGRLRPVGRRGRGRQGGAHPGRVRRDAGRALEEGSCRLGTGWSPDRAASPERGVPHLHPREPGRAADLDPQVVRRPAPGDSRRRRSAGRAGRHHGDQPPRAARGRRRFDAEPRAHPDFQHPCQCLEGRQRPRAGLR